MSVPFGVLAACLVGLASAAGFIANETTEGGMSNMMGLGHHHMTGSGCTANATAPMMANSTMPCNSGGMHGGGGMHGQG